jgi:hypothetical protein
LINHYRWAVGELRHKLKSSPHAFNVMTHCREKHIATLFEPGNGVLANPQGSSHLLLGLLHSLTQIFERGQLHGPTLYPLLPFFGQRGNYIIQLLLILFC